jgi:hypothetical protein
MKYSTVEDVMSSFPHPILPTVEGEPDYQTIHATRKFFQANSRAIDTHFICPCIRAGAHAGMREWE